MQLDQVPAWNGLLLCAVVGGMSYRYAIATGSLGLFVRAGLALQKRFITSLVGKLIGRLHLKLNVTNRAFTHSSWIKIFLPDCWITTQRQLFQQLSEEGDPSA
jgi:hypothetical protein